MRLGRPGLPGAGVAMRRKAVFARSREVRVTPPGRPRWRAAPFAALAAPSAPAYQHAAPPSIRRPVQAPAIIVTSRQARACFDCSAACEPGVWTQRANATGRQTGRCSSGRFTTIPATTQQCPHRTGLLPLPFAVPAPALAVVLVLAVGS